MVEVVRSGPLTLSQQRMWLRSYWREQGELFPGWSRLWELPAGITVADATAAMTTLVQRHEILRTAFTIGPDGMPMQVVFDHCGFRLPLSVAPLETLDEFLSARTEPLLVGGRSRALLWAMRLFTEGGEVRRVSLVFDHIISDGAGLYNWRTQFVDLCLGRKAAMPSMQPLDRQAEEARLLRANARNDNRSPYAETAPHIAAPRSREQFSGARYLTCSGRYSGLLPALDRICRESGASRSMVLMYVVGWLVSKYSGSTDIQFANYLANRMTVDDGLECQVRLVDQLVAVDDTVTFSEALDDLCSATLRAYDENYRFGPLTPESRARAAASRGVGAIVPVYFNFQGPPRPSDPVRRAHPESAEAESAHAEPVTVERTDLWETLGRPWGMVAWVYLQGAGMVLDLDVDVAMVPERTVHAMIDVLPQLLEFMAANPSRAVGEAEALLPADYRASTSCIQIGIGGSWADLAAVGRVLESAPGVLAATAAVESGELVAHVTLESGSAPFDVHEHLLSALIHHLDIVAPSLYSYRFSHDGAPEQWRPSSQTPELPPATALERELAEAIRETHGHAVSNMALSYVLAGGRMLLAPAVTEVLRRRGLVGLKSHHFTSPCTLRSVARSLAAAPRKPIDGASYGF